MTAVLAAAFAILTAAVAAGSPALLRIDDAAVLAANALIAVNAGLRIGATVVSDAGSPVAADLVVGVLVLRLLWRHRARAALVILFVRLVELAIETLVKVVIDRPRPLVPVVITDARLPTRAGRAFRPVTLQAPARWSLHFSCCCCRGYAALRHRPW